MQTTNRKNLGMGKLCVALMLVGVLVSGCTGTDVDTSSTAPTSTVAEKPLLAHGRHGRILTAVRDPRVAVAPKNRPRYGDITGDGAVNVVDVQCMQLVLGWIARGAYGTGPACMSSVGAADLNCDGAVNVVDYILAITLAKGQPLHPDLDSNGDGIHDACQ